MAAKKSKSPAFELAKSMLEKNPDVSYAEVKAAADKKSIAIFPIVYGRAKGALGLVESKSPTRKKAGRKKATAEAAAPAAAMGMDQPVRRGPGRPRKNPAPAMSMAAGLDGVIAAMKANEAARERYQGVLVKIRDLINSVM